MCLQRRDKKYVEHLQPGQGLWNLPNKPETIKKKKKKKLQWQQQNYLSCAFNLCTQFLVLRRNSEMILYLTLNFREKKTNFLCMKYLSVVLQLL